VEAAVIPAKLDVVASASNDASGACLSDEEVLAFANGTLHADRHLEAHFHFDQCEVCQRLLSEAAHALATAVTAPFLESEQLSWHTTFQPGTLVGHRYLIRHFIARGGMGEVYEAFDRELQERVALKTVTSTACDNASAVRRLKAEVQLARRVSHPNVCRIYDFGTHVMAETGAQISFLTMEFVDGETLGQRVRLAGPMPVDEARALGRQLLRGLAAAHEAGVLHRDFKSDNVMLRAEPSGGCSPLILDFGLARALDAGSRSTSGSHSNLLGTFGYIAPEQLEGRPHTTASDVYSFGLVWFEMLTGELPFDSPTSPVSRALARLQSAATAPSRRNPLVPGDLDAVVLGCLRRSPKERYQTARDVLEALDALETRARRVSPKRKLLPLCLGALLGGVAAYATLVSSSHPPPREITFQPNLPSPAEQTTALGKPPELAPSPVQQPNVPPLPGSAPRETPLPTPPSRDLKIPKAPAPFAASATASATTAERDPPAAPAPTAAGSAPPSATAGHFPDAPPARDTPPKKALPPWENPFGDGTASAHAAGGPQ